MNDHFKINLPLKKEKSDHICDHEELMFVQIKNKSFTQALDTSKQIGYYKLNSLNARDVDYKELVDESTRLYLKYEDPEQLNDNEKKRFQNLTFISWRASLICQYKFEIFKVLDHPARAFAWIDLASKLFSHLIFVGTSYLRSEFDDLFMRKTYSCLMMSKFAAHNDSEESSRESSGESSEESSGESSGESFGESSGENPGETSGKTSGENPEKNTGESSGAISGRTSGENSAFMSLYNFITNNLSSSQHIWCINKTRIAYNLEIEDLKPFLQFWIKHCNETMDNHTDGCTCVAKMKNRVVTYLNTLMINKHFSKDE